MPDPSPLPIPNTARLAEGTTPVKAQESPSLLGPDRSRARAWREGAQEASGARLLLLPPLFCFLYCGLRGGLFHLCAWFLTTVPRAWLDIITMTTAIEEHTDNRDEIDKRLACHEKYNKFLI